MVKFTKVDAEKMLGDVPQEKRFWCCDGRVLKNLLELETALNEMSEETFCYHKNEAKNDFSNWVRDVVGDEKLSRDLQKSISRAQAARSVGNRIVWLRSKVVTR